MYPLLFLAVFLQSRLHLLPAFLGHLENLDYPKDSIYLYIRLCESVLDDESRNIIQHWSKHAKLLYSNVDYEHCQEPISSKREALAEIKDTALKRARKTEASFAFFVGIDIFFTNARTLQLLIAENRTVIAPMLRGLNSYSNFWNISNYSGDEFSYYKTPEFEQLFLRKKIETFAVSHLRSAFLINLQHPESALLNFKATKACVPVDVCAFSQSAVAANIQLYVTNAAEFGLIVDDTASSTAEDLLYFDYVKLEALVEGPPGLLTSPLLADYYEEHKQKHEVFDKLGFDEVFLINLDRRGERRIRMEQSLAILGLDFRRLSAVDGRLLSNESLQELGITLMPDFADPFHQRPMTFGEIGCFLSHYNIWKEVVLRKMNRVLILEDDVRFCFDFRGAVQSVLAEADANAPFWELIYFGRKRMQTDEQMVEGCSRLSTVGYSYWTLAYVLNYSGALKLINSEPLKNLLPVDEFLPIMFDEHPEDYWKAYFRTRTLRAYSAEPLIVSPTHYTGNQNYVSDTESAFLVANITAYETESASATSFENLSSPPILHSFKDEL